MKPSSNDAGIQNPKGFALVVTVSLLVLLSAIALGFLSLSAVSLRSSSQDQAQMEARANARLALQIAIGELQKYTGADTRITAPANIVESSAPPVVGAWRSWEGLNHDVTGATAGRPIRPDYDIKNQPANAGADGRFLTWLISGAREGENRDTPSQLAWTNTVDAPEPPALFINLLGKGSVDEAIPGQRLAVAPQPVEGKKGAIAWWVSPENQKARLAQPHQPDGNEAAHWSDLQRSHGIPDPEPFGLDALVDDPESYNPHLQSPKAARKAISLATTELISDNNPAKPQQSFHDLTTSATGLLTNVATGGWKKDMSILSERWSQLPASGLPMFRLQPSAGAGSTTLYTKPTTTNPTPAAPAKSLFYPWSDYVPATTPNASNPNPFYYMRRHGAVTSWHALVDHLTSYKTMDYDASAGVASVPLTWARSHRATPWGPSAGNFSNQDLFRYLHLNQKSPVLARIQWVFKVRSRRQNPADPNTRFNIDLLVTPVYTLWNPHNVAIRIEQYYGVALNKTMPVAIAFVRGADTLNYTAPPNMAGMFRRYIKGTIGDMERLGNNMYDSALPGNYAGDWEISNNQAAGFPIDITLAPGEARQFSLAANKAVGNTGVIGVLKEGYDGANAFGFAGFNTTTGVFNAIRTNFLRTDTLKLGMRFDNLTRLGAASERQGPGIHLDFGRWAGPSGNQYLGDAYYDYSMLTNLDFSKAYWNEPVDLPQYPVLSIEDNGLNPPWTPVFSIIWGPRLSMGTAAGTPANRPTKGMVQNSPFAAGVLTTSEKLATNHPAHLPFDFIYVGHQMNSDTLPEEGIPGFIVSGTQAGNGLSRLVVGDIPMRPMVSLMELQGWDLRARNPLPPFQYNIIGNSDANPMIPREAVVAVPSADPATNRQHDDAYCANHLLFDDWFLSSIAPEPVNFGKTMSRDISTVYRDYLKGDRGLVNRPYRPISADNKISDTEAATRIGQIITSNDGWQKVASRFEVEGMFNINSTSVKAWRALLGHARKQQVAYHTRNGIFLDVDEPQEHVVSRGAVASDLKAGPDTGMAGIFPNASEYSGFRTLTDAQLDLLAERIVEQIRARGPFLSLSEFVNRRLDADDDLALAGAVQSALNTLAAEIHPRLQDPAYASTTMDPGAAIMEGADYAYEKASNGYNTYGLPGWIRQADVLRPIAPILSARDDTFTIRAYGDARDVSGRVIARAWCEAVVTRTRDFVDPADAPDSIEPPTRPVNMQYGRRYVVTSFRWLAHDEV
jgi:hypothetical protein